MNFTHKGVNLVSDLRGWLRQSNTQTIVYFLQNFTFNLDSYRELALMDLDVELYNFL